MNEKNKIAFLGGDKRQYTAALKISEHGWESCIWGQERESIKSVQIADSLEEALHGARAVVLPLPASLDGITLNCIPEGREGRVRLETILKSLTDRDGACVIGGKLSLGFVAEARERNIPCFDYFESEAFQIKNAYITAEAALSIAMDNIPKTVRGSRFALTGYGRISKQLVELLRGFGAEVTVLARKERDIASAELSGCKTINIGGDIHEAIKPLLHGYDVIFNTVPSLIFERDFLERVNNRTLIIELASAPGGIDVSAARALGSRVLWASALPGKYAPQSAGELIGECVEKILREGEVRV
jgi:dipicolinate synthase subunit A